MMNFSAEKGQSVNGEGAARRARRPVTSGGGQGEANGGLDGGIVAVTAVE